MSTITMIGGPVDGRTVRIEGPGFTRIIVPELFHGQFVKHEYTPFGVYVGVLREWVRSCPFDVDLFPRWTRFVARFYTPKEQV